MAKFFKVPFAQNGDRVPVPDATQSDGSISYQQGFGYDYERPKSDPDHKLIERDTTNQLFHDLTAALREIQMYGAALWTADAAPYPIGAQVYHSDGIWIAARATSESPGAGNTDWFRGPTPTPGENVPIGVAMPYFGRVEDIPSNWSICNGENGTPNLTDRFVVGAGGQYGRGQTGGSTATSTAGAHNHPVSVDGTSLSGSQMPPHNHSVTVPRMSVSYVQSGSGATLSTGLGAESVTSDTAGSGAPHSHGASSGNSGSHNHTALPPYYAQIWIIRVY